MVFAGLDFYKNYSGEKNVDEINETLTDILDDYDFIEEEPENVDIEYIDTVENEEDNETPTTSNEPSSYYTEYNQLFDDLTKINDETVGWLTVNNTKVNYPVVQHTDNDYGL